MTSRSMSLTPWRQSISTQRALQHLAAAQIIVDQEAPLPRDVLRRLGEAVAGHVDEPQPDRLADVEEVELLRPPRRVGGAGEAVAVGQRLSSDDLPTLERPAKAISGTVGIGQELQLRRRLQEGDRPGKELPGRLLERHLVAVALGALTSSAAGGRRLFDAALAPAATASAPTAQAERCRRHGGRRLLTPSCC